MAGEILKKRREELGRDIQEIADLLKIRTDCIRAIEEDAVEKLPAPVYTIGYIRCYAKYLGIDADPIVDYYSKNLSQPRPSTIIPIAFSQRKRPKVTYALLAAFLVMIALFAADYLRNRPADRAEVAPSESPTVEAAHVRPEEAKEKGAAGVPETQSSAAAASAGQESAGAAPTAPSAVTEKRSPAAEVHTLIISGTGKTWMRLRFRDGKSEDVLLEPGESRTWSFSGNVSLKIGNAGGVNLNLDGANLGRPGGSGQIVTLSLPAQ